MRIKSLMRLGRNFFSRAVISLVLLAGFWVGLSATPLPPPLFCVDDETCVESPTSVPPPPSTGDGYTLADATAGLPFTLNLPIPPAITSEVTVTPATIASNKVNGRRLILQPGNYGNQVFGTQDQEIVIQPGVEIGTLSLDNTARRLHFRGSPARAGRISTIMTGGSWNNPISDLLFDGITANDTGSPSTNNIHGTRVAVINSSLMAENYAMGNFHLVNDFLLANSYVHTYGSTQANMRSHSALRYVVVDSRLRKSGSGHHALRVHGDDSTSTRPAHNIYIARNQIDGGRVTIRGTGTSGGENGQEAGSSAGINTVWFLDNVIYQPGDANASLYTGSNIHDSDRPQMMYVQNNMLYSDRATWFSPGQPRSNWAVQNNQHSPYQPPPENWDFR
jgi:hypothetical protein